ncbi:MFS general substrate transporter [Apiospora arundinis]
MTDKQVSEQDLNAEQVVIDMPGGDQHGTTARDSQKGRKPVSFHVSLLCLGLLALIVAWDTTALTVALPMIAAQLQATTLEAMFASIAFTLAVAVSQPLYLSISDAVGRKVPLYVAMLLLAVGSIVFAVAQSIMVVIIGQGKSMSKTLILCFASGGLDILQEIIIIDMTNLKERPKYLALMALPICLGSIIGPIVGALLCQFVTWRWLGWINLPFVGPALPLAVLFMNLQPIDQDLKTKLRRLDWVGMLLFAVGAACVSLPISWADTLFPWSSWRTIVPLALGIVAFVAFGFYEARPYQPMLPYSLFQNRTAVVSIIGGSIHGLILFSFLLYLPLFFQLRAGWVVLTLFTGLCCFVDQTTSKAQMNTFLAFIGVGLGIVFQTIPFPLQASVDDADDVGRIVGLLVITRFLGGLLGLAINSVVFNSGFADQIAAFGPLPAEVSQLSDPRQALGFIPALRSLNLDEAMARRLTEAYRVSFRAVWIVLTSASGVGLATSFLTKQLDLEREELGRQRFNDRS